MSRLGIFFATLALGTLAAQAVQADAKLDDRVAAANRVLTEFQRMPEKAVPPNLLNHAYAVAIVPNLLRGGFIVGGSYGKGVLLKRHPDGSWSNPVFIEVMDGSLGFQWGFQGADVVMVFKSPKSLDGLSNGTFTLGNSATATAGPYGRSAGAGSDQGFKLPEIYTYAQTRGLFLGVAWEGGHMAIDKLANYTWYGNTKDGSAEAILNDTEHSAPAAAKPLQETLAAMAPAFSWQPEDKQVAKETAPAPAPGTENNRTESKTYAVEDGAAPAPETMF